MNECVLDAINRPAWSKRSARRQLGAGSGFVDAGEAAGLSHVTRELRRRPILDLGIGTGRTVPLLMPLTDDYRAVDYLPAMVEACRRAHPGVSVQLGDARDLRGFPEGHFGLVCFSYNGIDAVSHEDRRRVFRAVRRVLAADGTFLFSTLNLAGPSYRERPWRVRIWGRRSPHRVALSVARQAVGLPRSLSNWLRIRRLAVEGDGYAVAPLSAHRFALLVHYTTLARQRDELREEGFDPDSPAFDSVRGGRVDARSDTSRVDWFTIAARRAAG
ncbi:MAG: class I SAM-dependent methyltransferase [Polyangiaceae bacterium]